MAKTKKSSPKSNLKPTRRKWFFLALGIFILGLLISTLAPLLFKQVPGEPLVSLDPFLGPYHCEESLKSCPIPAGSFFNIQAENGNLLARWSGDSWILFRKPDGDFRVQGTQIDVTFAERQNGDVFGLSARIGSDVFLKASKPR